jgi:hypothetical protein
MRFGKIRMGRHQTIPVANSNKLIDRELKPFVLSGHRHPFL